jgi:hypothetical protein
MTSSPSSAKPSPVENFLRSSLDGVKQNLITTTLGVVATVGLAVGVPAFIGGKTQERANRFYTNVGSNLTPVLAATGAIGGFAGTLYTALNFHGVARGCRNAIKICTGQDGEKTEDKPPETPPATMPLWGNQGIDVGGSIDLGTVGGRAIQIQR